MNQTRIRPCRLTALLLTLLLMLAMSPAALADTDENTPSSLSSWFFSWASAGPGWSSSFARTPDASRFPWWWMSPAS